MLDPRRTLLFSCMYERLWPEGVANGPLVALNDKPISKKKAA